MIVMVICNKCKSKWGLWNVCKFIFICTKLVYTNVSQHTEHSETLETFLTLDSFHYEGLQLWNRVICKHTSKTWKLIWEIHILMAFKIPIDLKKKKKSLECKICNMTYAFFICFSLEVCLLQEWHNQCMRALECHILFFSTRKVDN